MVMQAMLDQVLPHTAAWISYSQAVELELRKEFWAGVQNLRVVGIQMIIAASIVDEIVWDL